MRPFDPRHRNLCCACGSDFASVRAFDFHRKGSVDNRRCDLKGLQRDARGRWNLPQERA